MDNIAAKVLQMAAPAIAPSLTEIFNMSMDNLHVRLNIDLGK